MPSREFADSPKYPSSSRSRRAPARPTAGRPKGGRQKAARGRLHGAGDRRNDGGIDGRRRLAGQGPTAIAEPIDKGRHRADRLAIALRGSGVTSAHGSPSGPRRGGAQDDAAEPLAAEPMGRGKSRGRAGTQRPAWWRAAWWRARRGRSPAAGPGPGSGPATPETLNNAQRTAGPSGPG